MEKQNRTLVGGKLIRISGEAHRATRVGAAIDDQTMEEWASMTLTEAGGLARFCQTQETYSEFDEVYGPMNFHFCTFSDVVAFAKNFVVAVHRGAGEVILSAIEDTDCIFGEAEEDHDQGVRNEHDYNSHCPKGCSSR
jgi:hypothetical protein